MILFSRKECNQKARAIENDIRRRWNWNVNVTVTQEGHVSWEGNQKVNQDRYDMYPGISKEQADARVMDEILSIIRQYIPNFQFTDYYQSGVMHYPTQG